MIVTCWQPGWLLWQQRTQMMMWWRSCDDPGDHWWRSCDNPSNNLKMALTTRMMTGDFLVAIFLMNWWWPWKKLSRSDGILRPQSLTFIAQIESFLSCWKTVKLDVITQNKLLNAPHFCDPEIFQTIFVYVEVYGDSAMKYGSTIHILAMVWESFACFSARDIRS